MKRILISILVSIFVMSIFTTAYAASASVILETSGREVNPGDTFTVEIEANGDGKVACMEGTLQYDTAKFSLEKKEILNGFTEGGTGNELNAGILTLEDVTLAKTVKMYKLTFKVLETAVEGEEPIEFKNIVLGIIDENQTQKDEVAPDARVMLTIAKEAEKEPAENGNKGDKPSKLPQTGIESSSVVIVGVLGAISIVSYVLFRRYRDI